MVEQALIGKIVSSHGVRGIVKVDLYIESADTISNLKTINNENGDKLFDVISLVKHKNLYLVKLEGVEDRNRSDELRGTELYIDSLELPELDEDEFFISELKSLEARDSKGDKFGTVRNVFNFGAGDILEIVKDSGEYFMLTFTKENVPIVNIKEKFIVIDEDSAISNKGDIKCTQ